MTDFSTADAVTAYQAASAAASTLRAGDRVESIDPAPSAWHRGLEGTVVQSVPRAGVVLVDFEGANGRGHNGDGTAGGSQWFVREDLVELIDEDDQDDLFEDDEDEADEPMPEDMKRTFAAMDLAGTVLEQLHGQRYPDAKAAIGLAFFTVCIADPKNKTPQQAMADMLELILRGEAVVNALFPGVKSNTVLARPQSDN